MPDWMSRLRAAFRRNRAGKVAAVILGTATWYGIQSVINFEARLREIPVSLRLPESRTRPRRTSSRRRAETDWCARPSATSSSSSVSPRRFGSLSASSRAR